MLFRSHYDTMFGTVFEKPTGEPYSPDFAAIANAYGIKGVRVNKAGEFKQALKEALADEKPCLIEVYMENAPVPTGGIWDINNIYKKRPSELL